MAFRSGSYFPWHKCCSGRSNRSKRARPPAPGEQHAEPPSAAGDVDAAGRARSGAVRRASTTANVTRAHRKTERPCRSPAAATTNVSNM